MKTKTKLLTAVASVMAIAAISCTTAVSAANSQKSYYNTDVNFLMGKEGKFYIRDNTYSPNINLVDISVSSGNYWSWFSNKTYAKAYARPATKYLGVQVKQYATFLDRGDKKCHAYNTNFSTLNVPWRVNNSYTELFNNNVGGNSSESRIRIDCIKLMQYNERGKLLPKNVRLNSSVTSIFS